MQSNIKYCMPLVHNDALLDFFYLWPRSLVHKLDSSNKALHYIMDLLHK
jgi:hypothetical protein